MLYFHFFAAQVSIQNPVIFSTRKTYLVLAMQMNTVSRQYFPLLELCCLRRDRSGGPWALAGEYASLSIAVATPQWIGSCIDQVAAPTNPVTETDKPCFSGTDNKTRLCRGSMSESKDSKRSVSLLG